MSIVVEYWAAWMKGWMGVTTAMLDAQRQSMERLRRVPDEAVGAPMARAVEASTEHLQQAHEEATQVVSEAADKTAADAQAVVEETEDEMLHAAGDKPASGRRRGRNKED